MKFRSCSSERARVFSPSGSRYRQLYQKRSDGKLDEAGIEDVYDTIQKASEGISVADLIKRANNGDSDAIPSVNSTGELDFSNAPRDMLEAHERLTKAKDEFSKMGADVKAKFKNSFENYLQAVCDGTVFQRLATKDFDAVSVDQTSSGLTPEEISKIKSMIGGNNDA